MAAFQQYPASFLLDSVFLPPINTPGFDEFIPHLNQFYPSSQNLEQTLINYNQEGSSIDAVSGHESSCLEQQSIDKPSSVTEKQSLSMADSDEQVIQSTSPVKKRKSRKGSSSISSNSTEAKQVNSKKKKKKKEEEITVKEAMKEEKNDNKTTMEEPPKDYIHVRARRGQATDSHSLAERVRREKISERMKRLQSLVPGCDKVTGKALMLDEIINYVQSLQNQVEFLSMKLATVDPTVYTFGLMDHDPMLFGTQGISNGIISDQQPQIVANTTSTTNVLSCSTTSSASTPNFPASIADSSANLYQQHHKPSLLPFQDAGSLYWGMNEQQRHSIINNQFGFNGTNLYSLQ